MKKSILITAAALAALGLTAFNWINVSDPEVDRKAPHTLLAAVLFSSHPVPYKVDIAYAVGSRFIATVTKEKLRSAQSVVELVPVEAKWGAYPIQSVKVALLHDGTETSETGNDAALNPAQAKLLGTLELSESFYLTAQVKGEDGVRGHDLVYYITVVPEQEASYSEGMGGLIDHIRQNTAAHAFIIARDRLKAGKVMFTITPTGQVDHVTLDATSGYASFDANVLELVSTLPGKWTPARDANGTAVAQQFMFSFGVIGC